MRNLLFLLHVYGCVASEQCCIFVQDRRDLLAQERLGLVYGHAGEGMGVNKFVELRAREPEDRVSQDALEQVVAAAMELDLFAGGDAVLPDGLVQGLPVAALFLDAVHEDVLRSEKRQLVGQMLFGHFRVHGQAADDVEVQREDAVGGEECFRDADAAVGRVVERALKPLGAGRDGGILQVADDVARQGGDALAAHGVALIGHGRGADLAALERLVHLFEVGQQADVAGKLRGALRDAGQHLQHLKVHLARIGLAADGVRAGKAHLFADLLLERDDLLLVAVKQGEEARARAGRALAAEELEIAELKLQLLEIHQQILRPERGALADGRRLRGLKMRVGERRLCLVRLGKVRERLDDVHQQAADLLERFAHEDDIRIVADVAGRGTEVQNGLCLRAARAVGQHVGHDVVPHLVLARRGVVIVDVRDVRAQLADLLIRDRQTELLLALGQRDPEPAPGGKFVVVGVNVLHRAPGVAGAQGVDVAVVHAYPLSAWRSAAEIRPLNRGCALFGRLLNSGWY